MAPAQIWVETFGEIARPIADLIMSQPPRYKKSANVAGYERDDQPITKDTVYCFASDDPHVEGGSDPYATSSARSWSRSGRP